MGASRFRSKDGLFHFGRIRRTDWLPVGARRDSEQVDRGDDSQDGEFDEQDAEMEQLWGEDEAASETMSTGYDDAFDQELAQMERWDADMENPEGHSPGDEGYDGEYELDHASLMEADADELHGLQG